VQETTAQRVKVGAATAGRLTKSIPIVFAASGDPTMDGFNLRDGVWEQRHDVASKFLGPRLIVH
jgi:hypothetical protein